VTDWELKKALPRHIWQDSLRADALRTRVLEMRYPRRDVDQDHDAGLSAFLSSLIRCRNDAELVAGVYFAVKVALMEAYETYLRDADPLDDAPTVAFMKGFAPQILEQLHEIRSLFAQLPKQDQKDAQQVWQHAVQTHLNQIGGIFGKAGGNAAVPETIASRPEYVPPAVPKRDTRFLAAVYHMPPRLPEKFIERQIWQGINHVNEMWAAEIPNLVIWKWNDMPWEFYLDCARWAYDESRHSMMGEERLKAWGFEIGVDYPVVADHYASVHERELDVLALLHAFETNGPSWKAGLKSDFEAVGDTASSQDFDYDWADESIHLQYGHKWTLHRLNGDIDALEDLIQDTRDRWYAWLERKRREWDYEPFMSRIQAKIKQIEEQAHA